MEITTAHIMVTSLCDRDCKYCCNKQYDLNSIPYITDEELKQMKHVYLTGGEPFKYSNPCEIADKLLTEYLNIESIVVYTNAKELYEYLDDHRRIYFIDGVNISIKTEEDKNLFEFFLVNDPQIRSLKHNRVYLFPGYEKLKYDIENIYYNDFEFVHRKWQEKFVPAPNCIFRKL